MQKKRILNSTVKKWIFYVALIFFPIIQFILFYVYVNINSIILAFQRYELNLGGDEASRYVWGGLVNFKRGIGEIFGIFGFNKSTALSNGFINSIVLTLIVLCISTPLTLLFSYVISKKIPLSGLFRFFLFIPSIVPSIVLSLVYLYFMEEALPETINKIFGGELGGLMFSKETRLPMLILYTVLVGFGPQTLIYVGSINSINEAQIEAGKIDGASMVQEFLHIVFPNIFPTFVTFTTVTLAGMFSNQFYLFNFYGIDADPQMYTLGYYLYRGVSLATLSNYPFYSALGVLCTLITIPIVITINKLMLRVGPSTESKNG